MNLDTLYDAAIAGDADARNKLSMQTSKLNAFGKTILHVESVRGNTERVKFILREFPNANLLVQLSKYYIRTALHNAVLGGHTEVVEVLIEAARHLPSSSSANDDTLDIPVTSFQAFLRHGDRNMDTALHLAVYGGHVDIVKLLVGADPTDRHSQNDDGKTPMYIAVERGYHEIVEIISTTCTDPSLDGPYGHSVVRIDNLDQVKSHSYKIQDRYAFYDAAISGDADAIAKLEMEADKLDCDGETILHIESRLGKTECVRFLLKEFANKNLLVKLNRWKQTALHLAVDGGGHTEVVEVLIEEARHLPNDDTHDNPGTSFQAFLRQANEDMNSALHLAVEGGHVDIVKLLVEADPTVLHAAIEKRDIYFVLSVLKYAKHLATVVDDKGWTLLHYAVFHELDSVLDAIIEAQKDLEYQFISEDMVQPPLLVVAAEKGYTSTVIRLMELWPTSSPVYTAVNNDGRNILHLAVAKNKKEMIQGILKYCPKKCKDKILKQQDVNGDTPLHLLISHGCFIPELIKHRGLDTLVRNKNRYTPRDMLYFEDDIIADQVKIKNALQHIQTSQFWKFWGKTMEKETESSVPPSIRERKDKLFNEQTKMDLEKYKERTNTQIIVTALITTITFTVGFTMPGGLRQSGEVDEGLVVFSKKTAFNAFMVSDALALLLSTSSLFFYFLQSMKEDPDQVSKLNAASTALNIVSVMAMMLTFIEGTYVVLSHSPALAITVCVIGSLFFILIIFLFIKEVCL